MSVLVRKEKEIVFIGEGVSIGGCGYTYSDYSFCISSFVVSWQLIALILTILEYSQSKSPYRTFRGSGKADNKRNRIETKTQ